MAYTISVSEFLEIAQIYISLAEESERQLCILYRKMEENCRRTKYKPMVDFVNSICDFYYGDFRSHLTSKFQEWESAPYSLANLARAIGGGEDAANVGKQEMDRIKDSLDSLFSGRPFEEIKMDTSHPGISNERILENTEYINTFLRALEDARDCAVVAITGHTAGNDAFVSIIGISRYMNTYETPHICACAATGEVRYVLSLIQYLVDCMNVRETFFARMGIDKIANFRELYPDIVMPRIFLIVDEFQQLFLEASSKEAEATRQCLTAIVKKEGRRGCIFRTGFCEW